MKKIVYDLVLAFDNGVRTSVIDDVQNYGIDVIDFAIYERNHTIELIVDNISDNLPSHIRVV